MAPYLYLFTTMALFGSAFAGSKVVVEDMPHEVAAVLRFGGGAVILLATVLISRKSGKALSLREATGAGLVGLLGIFAYNLFFFWGLSLAPSLDAVVIVPVLSPVLVTGYLVLSGREGAAAARVAGLLLGTAGAVVFFLGIDSGFQGTRLRGDFIYLLAALSWSVYSVTAKKVLAGVDPLRATTCSMVVGAVALTLVAVPSFPRVEWSDVSGLAWANAAFLAIGPTALAHWCYYRGLRSVSPSTATIMMFVSPVFGAVCSVVFLGESFSVVQVTGAFVMMCGALLAMVQGGPHPAKAGGRLPRSGPVRG